MSGNNHFTSGSIGKMMIRTAIAMLPGTIAISGYNLADTFFVSQLGKLPLAAMGFTFPVIMLIGCVFRGLGIGVMTPVAHALGGGKERKAASLVSSGLLLIALVSVAIGITGSLTIPWTFRQFNANAEVMPYISDYMVIWYLGCLTSSLMMAGNDLVIASGSPRATSLIMLGGLALNVVLDPWFIFGGFGVPAMGIEGAALATVLSQLAGLAAVAAILRRKRLLALAAIVREKLLLFWGVVIRIAIPSMIGMLMMPIGSCVLTRIVAEFGNDAVAATAAAGRLEIIAFIFPMALGISLTPMVAQNFGARLYHRIYDCERLSFRLILLFELGVAGLYFVFAPLLVRFFSDDPEVMRIMVLYLRIISFGFGLQEIHRFSGFFYTGCNRPQVAAWLNALRVLGLLIPFSLLALLFHSLPLLFVGRLLTDVLAGTVGWLLTLRLTRQLLSRDSL